MLLQVIPTKAFSLSSLSLSHWEQVVNHFHFTCVSFKRKKSGEFLLLHGSSSWVQQLLGTLLF